MAAVGRNASSAHDLALLVGRILLAALLLIAAYNKAKGYGGSLAYFTRLGIPQPQIALPAALAFEVIVGLMLIIGYRVSAVALLLAVYVIIAGLYAHTNFADLNQLNHFLKNCGIAGGCLALFVTGGGNYAADVRRRL